MTISYECSDQNIDNYVKEIVEKYQSEELHEEIMLQIFEKYAKKISKKRRGRPSKKETIHNDYKINYNVNKEKYQNQEWTINLINNKNNIFKLYVKNNTPKIVTCSFMSSKNQNIKNNDDCDLKEYIFQELANVPSFCENLIMEKLMEGFYYEFIKN